MGLVRFELQRRARLEGGNASEKETESERATMTRSRVVRVVVAFASHFGTIVAAVVGRHALDD